MATGHVTAMKPLRVAACRRALASWLTLCGLTLAGAAQCAAQSFTSFDPPGSINTFPQSINASGAITGIYCVSPVCQVQHGFLRDPDGTITSFDVPGSDSTYAVSINDCGGDHRELLLVRRHPWLCVSVTCDQSDFPCSKQ